MKKKLLVLSVLALSGISTATLASCDKFAGSTTTPSESISKTITGISVTGQNTEYGIGDSINQGAGARVSVNYSDGTSSDSTATAKFDFSAVDASKAGKYTVKVTCQGKETSYEVEVKEYVFTGIEADTSKADLNYYLYSVYNFDDVVINALYKHPVTNEVTKKVLNNADVAFKVTDSNNTEIGTQFLAFGDYNVEASYNGAKCNFAVKCVTVDAKTIAEAMEVASKTESSIASGSSKYTLAGTYNTTETIDYVYGQSFVKTINRTTKKNKYYSVMGDEGFAVVIDADDDGNDKEGATPSIFVPQTTDEFLPEVEDAKYIGLNIFKDGTKYYGVYAAVEKLYEEYSTLAEIKAEQCTSNVGACAHLDNAEGFSFKYNRLNDSASGGFTFERVTVEFTINEAGAINKAYINIEKFKTDTDGFYYTADDLKNNKELPEDLPIEIKSVENEAGNTVRYFIVTDESKAKIDTTTWEFSQASGVKASDDENPYLASKIAVSDFKILDADGNELEDGKKISLDLDNGNSTKDEGNHRFVLSYTIGNVLPETANIDLDQVSVKVTGTGKDGHVLGDSDYGYAFASKSDDGLVVRFNRPGDYDVTFKTSGVTKVLHYSVDYEAPFTIAGTVHDGEEKSSFVTENSFAMYKSNKIYIGANIGDPSGQNADVFEPGFTAAVDKETGHLEKTTLNVNGKDVECYAFTATEAGDYVITLTGATPDSDRAAATTTVTITVAENPSLASILAKYDNKYEAVVSEDEIYSLEFTDGAFTVYNKYDHEKYANYTYTYDEETRAFTCIPGLSSGIDKSFELSMSNYYVLSLVDTEEKTSYILKKPTSDITDEDLALLKGKYTCSVMNGRVNYSFVFTPGDEKGTGSLVVSVDQGNGAVDYTYTYEFDTKTRKLVPTLTEGKTSSDPLNGHDVTINSDSQLVYSSSFGDVVLEKKTISLSELLDAKYTVTANGADYTFEFTVNDDGVTGTCSVARSSRKGNYSWTFDSSTNVVTLTKTGGKDCYITGFVVENGDLYYWYSPTSIKEKCTKEGSSTPSEPDTPVEIVIPEAMYGTWNPTEDAGYGSIVISKDSVMVDNVAVKVVSVKGNVMVINDTSTYGYGEITITLTSTGLSVSYYSGVVVLDYVSKPAYNPLEELVGTWISEDGYYTIVISSNSITMDGSAGTVSDVTSDGFTVTISGIPYQAYVSDGNLILDSRPTGEIVFSKKTDDNDDSQSDISKYIGNWYTSNGDSLVITETTVTLDAGEEITGTIKSVTSSKLIFTVSDFMGDYDIELTFENGTLIYEDLEFEKGQSTVEIDESFIGTWKDDENEITLIISASSVNWNGNDCSGIAYSQGYLKFNIEGVGTASASINETTGHLDVSLSAYDHFEFVKQTPSSESDVDLSSYYGWYENGSDQIGIISSGILIGDDVYTVDSKAIVDGVVTINASLDSTRVTITITGNSLIYNGVTYTK